MASDNLLRIGGIKGVSLWSPLNISGLNSPPLSDEDLAAITSEQIISEAIEIPLIEGGSSYIENASYDCGAKIVTHTLYLSSPLEEDILSYTGLEEWWRHGLVAVVQFNSRSQIVIGYSERMALGRMLRLSSIESSSGLQRTEQPTKVWCFSSCDFDTLL